MTTQTPTTQIRIIKINIIRIPNEKFIRKNLKKKLNMKISKYV